MSIFNASQVDLHTASKEDVLCFLALSDNGYNGHLGARISSIFVISFVSYAFTVFPIPCGVYLFARYFGTGVIATTAFIHLLDPAYKRIWPKICVGQSGYWRGYSWCAAIVLGPVMIIFLLDLAAEVYVERKYGVHRDEDATGAFIQGKHHCSQSEEEPYGQEKTSESDSVVAERSFRQQIAAILILEFGIIFHPAIIGLNLGVAGSEFATLYPDLILCTMYRLTTPVSIAIDLSVQNTYNPESKTALIVRGVLNAISTGVLIYSGLVELLARDFLFDPCRTKRRSHLLFMVFRTLLGAGIMALIGKWA
ncbi:hypothetical protein BDV29DRAFT_201434 [Aspergillus leporis]|uniref:Zinc/iron permease n=1 Tax=Aspergillus leporis TaxID=41062 RepID=A0A5N5X497_9EURO|nr:hypothetical protein BDV29DRAFT_201434 [Aspergillus leporis]